MITNNIAVGLGQVFQPILLFDPTERFFPVVAEETLDHRATEPWSDPNTHERGSAVLVAERSATTFGDANVRAGSHAPAGGHIALSPTPPNGIGQVFGADPTHQDLFLDVAGWQNAVTSDPTAPRFTIGSIDYLDLLFRALSHVLNPSLPLDQPTRPLEFTIPRSTSPTIYFECEWAGMYPRLDSRRVAQVSGSRDFPPAIGSNPASAGGVLTDLDPYVALTYYMLYPAMEPSPSVRNDDGAVRKKEGQWEAITVFLRGRPGDHHDEDGRPDFPVEVTENGVVEGLEPRFLAYSRGYEFAGDVDSPLAAEVRLFPNAIIFNNHSVAYVTAGTHKNLFEIGAIVNTGDSPPNPVLNPLGGAIMGAAGTAAGICLALAPPPLTPACIVCLIISAVVFLIGLILFILSFFLKDDPPVTEAPNPGSTDLARDGGPGALPSGQAPPHRPGVQPVGAVLTATLRIINRFRFDPVPPVTTYPLPAPLTVELPTWWDFLGRWGTRIINRATNEWDSGSRRTDRFGRSRAYWNTYRLVSFLNDPARRADGITA